MALTAKKVYAILKRQISDMEAKLNSPVRYRGTVATADLLPLNPDIGDMYNIESKSVYGEAGMNVAWNGVVWDTMGAPIDMSLYLTKEEAEAVIQRLVTEYFEKNPVKPGATTEQAQQIEQNKTDIASLKTETGSLKEDIENKTDFELWKNIVTIGGESIIQFLNIPIEEKIKDVFVVCNKLLISGSCTIIVQTRYNGFDTSNNATSVRRGVSKDDNIMIGFETFGKIRVDKSLKNNDDDFINKISAFNSKYTVSDMYKNNIARMEIILNNNTTFLEGCELQIYIRR